MGKDISVLDDERVHATVRKLTTSDEVCELWQALEEKSDTHFFHSWHWVGTWLDLVLANTEVYLFSCSIGKRWVGACFFTVGSSTRKKGLVRTTQLRVNEYLHKNCNMVIAYNGLLAEPDYIDLTWQHFFKAVEKFDRTWDEIVFSSLPDIEYQRSLKQAGQLTPVVEKTFYRWTRQLNVPSPARTSILDAFKKKSRQQMRQTLTAFSELGEVKLSAAISSDEALAMFDAMKTLHTQRWELEEKGGSYANTQWVAFHHSLIKEYFSVGVVQMLSISCGGEVIGYLYGHVYRGRVYMHQTGFAQMSDNRFRPGYVSHFEAMCFNSSLGFVEYDWLPDAADCYKKFFSDQGEPIRWIMFQRKRWVFAWEHFLAKLMELKQKIVSK